MDATGNGKSTMWVRREKEVAGLSQHQRFAELSNTRYGDDGRCPLLLPGHFCSA